MSQIWFASGILLIFFPLCDYCFCVRFLLIKPLFPPPPPVIIETLTDSLWADGDIDLPKVTASATVVRTICGVFFFFRSECGQLLWQTIDIDISDQLALGLIVTNTYVKTQVIKPFKSTIQLSLLLFLILFCLIKYNVSLLFTFRFVRPVPRLLVPGC